MKLLVLSSLILLSNLAYAEPYASADAKAGKMLVEKNCVSCHAESFGGNGSGIYTRESER
jgi:cytochrome c553